MDAAPYGLMSDETEGVAWDLVVSNDTAEAVDATAPDIAPKTDPYRVTVECGLFKRATHWPEGSVIELTEAAAAAFLAAGEVEAI